MKIRNQLTEVAFLRGGPRNGATFLVKKGIEVLQAVDLPKEVVDICAASEKLTPDDAEGRVHTYRLADVKQDGTLIFNHQPELS